VQISDIDIKLEGGLSWLYNIFVDAFKGTIISSVESALQNELNTLIDNTLESVLAKAPVVVPLGQHALLQIDFSLEEAPTVASSYLDVAILGLIQDTADPLSCDCVSVTMPSSVVSHRMAQVAISACVANCGFQSIQQAGLAAYTITPNDVPADSPVQLSTSNLALLAAFPGLSALCENCNITMLVRALEAPTASFDSTTGTTVVVDGEITLLTLQRNGTLTTALVLGANVSVSAAVTIERDQDVVLRIENTTDAALVVIKSYIGAVEESELKGMLELLLRFGIPVINADLAAGFPLPAIDGVNFVSSVVTVMDQYVLVATNVTYTSA